MDNAYAILSWTEENPSGSAAVPVRARITTRGSVMAFLGAKGGVGTTTVAVNVGAALSRHARVIVCELQSGGGFQSFLSKAPELTIPYLKRLNFHPEAVRTALCEVSNNLQLLVAATSPAEYLELDAQDVRKLLDILTGLADFVVLDLPSQLSPATRAALAECDRVSLVVDREPASVRAGTASISMLRSLGVKTTALGAVTVNRGAAAAEPLSEVRARLGCDLIAVVPPASTSCYLSHRLGRPFVVLQPQEAASLAISHLAERLRKPEPEPSIA